ncbi:MAG TPA: transketolase C-terminal domain-containing protein, partial [Balneolales bacterium]|nr:transketolase C-terminal domain-containing protein [Balneolales bacterium]
PAERDQAKWHAQGSPFDKITGKSLVAKKSHETPKYQKVFGDTIIDLAKKNDKIVGITAAMPSGTGLLDMMEQLPERAFDVGIAEQHGVTYAAGLATQGIKPFVAIYSTFLQRAYDQVIHDVVIQNLPVVFCMDRAGLVGADGATHHGLFDIAYLRCLPNIVVSAPMNENELRNLMFTASEYQNGPFAIRYPRGKGVGMAWNGDYQKMKIGKGECIRDGEEIAILSYGTIGNYVTQATDELTRSEDIQIGHYNMRFVKPLDTALIDEIMTKYSHIITIEDGVKTGGFGSAVAEYVVSKKNPIPITILGVPDYIVEQGTQAELHADCGIDKNGIIKQVKKLLLETA